MALDRVGFIGLGRMGLWMARNLRRAGHPIVACDVSASAVDKLREQLVADSPSLSDGVEHVSTPAELGRRGVSTLVTMLPSSKEVLEVYEGTNGFLKTAPKNSLMIDSTTGDPSVSHRVAEASKRAGSVYVDSPVSGGVTASRDAKLTFMVGAKQEQHFERAKPILLRMGARAFYCGKVGNGNAAKICNNMLLGISMIGTSEAMNLGVKLGLDPKLLAQVINSSSGRCWSSEVYNPVPGVVPGVPPSNNYNNGFAVALMTKDLGLASSAATSNGAPIPLGSLAHQLYRVLCAHGLGEKDFGIAFQFLQQNSTEGKK